MTAASPPDAAGLDLLTHLTLQVGRILLQNGSDTEQVQASMVRFATAFGVETNLLVSYEAVLVTVVAGEQIRTKVGHRLPGIGVGMVAIEAVNRLVDDAGSGRLRLDDVQAALDAIEHQPPAYPGWLVVAGLGMTAASLGRLFGGDGFACLAAGLAGMAGTWVRLELGRRHVNPVASAFLVVLLSGIAGGVIMDLVPSHTPALALVAPAMILVPGVPLINGILDMIRNHVTMGLSRLGFASLVVLAIALGMFGATRLTGVGVPVDSADGHGWRAAGCVVLGARGGGLCAAVQRAGADGVGLRRLRRCQPHAADPAVPLWAGPDNRHPDRCTGGWLARPGLCPALPRAHGGAGVSWCRRDDSRRLCLPRGVRHAADC